MPMKPFYEVLVSNIGKVHEGSSRVAAEKVYRTYVAQSKSGRGRAGGEDVSLWKNNEPIKEHFGTVTESNPRGQTGYLTQNTGGDYVLKTSKGGTYPVSAAQVARLQKAGVKFKGRERNPSGGYELFYASGGHGGPYSTYAEAEKAAIRLLKGSRSETSISIRPRTKGGVGGYGASVGRVVREKENPKRRKRGKCECSDPGCPVHKGVSNCTRKAVVTVKRVDMEDRTGTDMCRACAADAYSSGVFD